MLIPHPLFAMHECPTAPEQDRGTKDRAFCIDQEWDLVSSGGGVSAKADAPERCRQREGPRHARHAEGRIRQERFLTCSRGTRDKRKYCRNDEDPLRKQHDPRLIGSGMSMGTELAPGSEVGCGRKLFPMLGARGTMPDPRSSPGARRRLARGERPHFLVVDDARMSRVLVCRMLESLDAEVTEAEDGEEAVAICRTSRFSVIIMDVFMPVMNGWEAARLIRSEDGVNRDTPIVALTASSMFQHSPGSKDMTDLLMKPITREKLFAKLAQWVTEGEVRWMRDAWSRHIAERHDTMRLPNCVSL